MTTLQQLRTDLATSYVKFKQELSSRYNLSGDMLNNPPALKQVAQQVSGNRCVYIYQKGKRPGQACGDPVHAGSNSYCKKHSKYDVPTPDGVAQPTVPKPAAPKGAKSEPSVVKINISENEYGNREHKPTGLVFEDIHTDFSGKPKKLVVGRQVGSTVLPLTEKDIEQCRLYGFEWSPDAVASPDSEEPNDDEAELEEVDILDEDQYTDNDEEQ